jgi:ribokinase
VRVAAVGHVEWIEFAQVQRMPAAGEIVHASEVFTAPGGGGAVTAVALARLAGERAGFYTALGDDELGHRAHDELEALGLRMHVAWREEPQRRAFVHLDAAGERTITVIGSRLGPTGDDALPWDELARADAVYFTAGDAAAARAARAAKTLVASARGLAALSEAGVELDALLASGSDAGERYEHGQIDPEPRLLIRTAGAAGGVWQRPDGEDGRYAAAALPGAAQDAYGCGDSFAAGLTFGLGQGLAVETALELGARCGATCLTGRGPYGRQLTAAEIA